MATLKASALPTLMNEITKIGSWLNIAIRLEVLGIILIVVTGGFVVLH